MIFSGQPNSGHAEKDETLTNEKEKKRTKDI
jgi:hypothetical protein